DCASALVAAQQTITSDAINDIANGEMKRCNFDIAISCVGFVFLAKISPALDHPHDLRIARQFHRLLISSICSRMRPGVEIVTIETRTAMGLSLSSILVRIIQDPMMS